jgi:hypothetical protein
MKTFYPYIFKEEAFKDAIDEVKAHKCTLHIIKSSFGFEIMPDGFDLSNQYYHDTDGSKVRCSAIATIFAGAGMNPIVHLYN